MEPETKVDKNDSNKLENEKQEIKEDNFDDSTFHCPYILHMNFESLDPSLALAFVCLCEEDYNDLIDRLNVRLFVNI